MFCDIIVCIMKIPHRTLPGVPGKVIKFNSVGNVDDWYYKETRDAITLAYMLLNTDLAVKEGGYPSMPSVLLMIDKTRKNGAIATTDPRLYGVREALFGKDEPVETEEGEDGLVSVHYDDEFVYGVYAQRSEDSQWVRVPSEEESFLYNILVEPKTGLHVSAVDYGDTKNARLKQVRTAQKYFDIIIIASDQLQELDKEKSVTVMEYVSPFLNEETSSSHFLPIRAYREIISGMSKNQWGSEAFSFRDLYQGSEKAILLLIARSIFLSAMNQGDLSLHKAIVGEEPSRKDRTAKRFYYSKRALAPLIRQFSATGAGISGALGAAAAIILSSGSGLEAEAVEMVQNFLAFSFITTIGGLAGTRVKRDSKRTRKRLEEFAQGISESSLTAFGIDEVPQSQNPVLLTAGTTGASRQEMKQKGFVFREEEPVRVYEIEMRSRATQPGSEASDSGSAELDASSQNTDAKDAAVEHSSQGGSQEDTIEMGTVLPSVTTTQPSPATRPVTLSTLTKRLNKLREGWMAYELDPMKALDYPLMLDATCAQTRNFLMALNEVGLLEDSMKAQEGSVSVEEFREAVLAAESAFFEAEGHAKKMRYAHLDSSQRKKIKDARPLVALLKDESATPHERVNAYRKAGDFLEGVLALPEAPIMGLLEASQNS